MLYKTFFKIINRYCQWIFEMYRIFFYNYIFDKNIIQHTRKHFFRLNYLEKNKLTNFKKIVENKRLNIEKIFLEKLCQQNGYLVLHTSNYKLVT